MFSTDAGLSFPNLKITEAYGLYCRNERGAVFQLSSEFCDYLCLPNIYLGSGSYRVSYLYLKEVGHGCMDGEACSRYQGFEAEAGRADIYGAEFRGATVDKLHKHSLVIGPRNL